MINRRDLLWYAKSIWTIVRHTKKRPILFLLFLAFLYQFLYLGKACLSKTDRISTFSLKIFSLHFMCLYNRVKCEYLGVKREFI